MPDDEFTFHDVLHPDKSWPREGFPLPDGCRVVNAQSDGILWGKSRIHLCLDDFICISGMADDRVMEALADV